MMKRAEYRDMLALVNNSDCMDILKEYAERRIEHARQQLETTIDTLTMHRLQGRILELRRFETLRDEVVKGSD